MARSIIIARALGIEKYAAFALIIAFVGPIQELCNSNIGAAIVRYGTLFQTESQNSKTLALQKAAYALTTTLYFVQLAVVTVAIWLFYDVFFQVPDLHWLVVLFAAASGCTLFDATIKPMLRLHDKFQLYAIVDILSALATIAIVFLASGYFQGSLQAVMLTVATVVFMASLATNIAGLWALRPELRGIGSVRLSELKGQWNELIRFTLGNSLAGTVEKMTRRCDVLLLGALAPGTAVAIYDVSRKIAMSIMLLRDPISLAAFPQISRLLAEKRYPEFCQMLSGAYRIVTVPAILFLAAIYFFGNSIASLWGKEFGEAGTTLFLLSCRSMLFLVFFWTMSLILSLGLIRFQLFTSAIATLLGFIAAVPLTLAFADTGMAFAMFAATLVCQVVFAVRGLRLGRLRSYGENALSPNAASNP